MRKAMLLLAVIGLGGSLLAADPVIGTWKLNIPGSKISPSGTAPKELTEVYKEADGDQIEFTRTGIQTDGASLSSKWTWPRHGGMVKRHLPAPLPREMSYVETLIEAGDWYVTVLQDGRQIAVIHKTFSKDGNTMIQTFWNVDENGKTTEQLLVFDKQ